MTSLFHHEKPDHYLVAHVDGGARGNPGPAGYGVVLEDEAGAPVAELTEFLGVRTNNFAEYAGLIAALAYAAAHRPDGLLVVSDSELLVKQMKGQYKVKSPDLQPLHKRASDLVRQLGWFDIRHVRREQNREADKLANQAMDSGTPGGTTVRANAYEKKPAPPKEANGVVKNGRVEFLGDPLPEGTLVKVRAKD